MPVSGAGWLRASGKTFWPWVPLAFIVPCTGILLAGLFADREPPPPVGELVPGTVVAIEADSSGRAAVALVHVDTSDGPVFCGINRRDFPDKRLPAPQTQLTVDYTPTGCAPAPVSEELPRWVLVAMGGGGLVLLGVLFMSNRRFGRGRFRRRRRLTGR